jgi:hypothetical protein
MGLLDAIGEKAAIRNQKVFLKKVGANISKLRRVKQVHGNSIIVFGKKSLKRLFEGDGLFTKESDVLLGIVTADCVPIFFWSENYSAVGIAHAGWRGVVKNTAREMIRTFQAHGIHPQNIHIFFGPSIQKCHFEIWPDGGHRGLRLYLRKRNRFLRSKKLLIEKRGRVFLDMEGILYNDLIRLGISKNHIDSKHECTFHLPKRFFSHRRTRDRFEHMMSVIGIRNR